MSACWALGRCQMLVSARSGPRVGSARPDREPERVKQLIGRERRPQIMISTKSLHLVRYTKHLAWDTR